MVLLVQVLDLPMKVTSLMMAGPFVLLSVHAVVLAPLSLPALVVPSLTGLPLTAQLFPRTTHLMLSSIAAAVFKRVAIAPPAALHARPLSPASLPFVATVPPSSSIQTI